MEQSEGSIRECNSHGKVVEPNTILHPNIRHLMTRGYCLKPGQGYVAYNHLKQSDLVPLSVFLDLQLLSQLVPVQEIVTSHHHFYRDFDTNYVSFRWFCLVCKVSNVFVLRFHNVPLDALEDVTGVHVSTSSYCVRGTTSLYLLLVPHSPF